MTLPYKCCQIYNVQKHKVSMNVFPIQFLLSLFSLDLFKARVSRTKALPRFPFTFLFSKGLSKSDPLKERSINNTATPTCNTFCHYVKNIFKNLFLMYRVLVYWVTDGGMVLVLTLKILNTLLLILNMQLSDFVIQTLSGSCCIFEFRYLLCIWTLLFSTKL